NTVLVSLVAENSSLDIKAQTKASGIVVDESGNGVSNVSIIVVGTNNATMTDKDGKFQIQANPGNTLEARFLGFKSSRTTISNLNNIRLVLIADESSIEEVQVVATGYQNIDRKLFTGATSKVNAKDAERSGVPD